MSGKAASLRVCIFGGPRLWRLGLQAMLTGRPSLVEVTEATGPAEVVRAPDIFLLDVHAGWSRA